MFTICADLLFITHISDILFDVSSVIDLYILNFATLNRLCNLKICCMQNNIYFLHLTISKSAVVFECVKLHSKYLNHLIFLETTFLTQKSCPCFVSLFLFIACIWFLSVKFRTHHLF